MAADNPRPQQLTAATSSNALSKGTAGGYPQPLRLLGSSNGPHPFSQPNLSSGMSSGPHATSNGKQQAAGYRQQASALCVVSPPPP